MSHRLTSGGAPRTREIPSASGDAWLREDARSLLGALGYSAEIFNVYSAGDSGEGCEVIEFTTPCDRGRTPWTAKVTYCEGRRFVACTLGWES